MVADVNNKQSENTLNQTNVRREYQSHTYAETALERAPVPTLDTHANADILQMIAEMELEASALAGRKLKTIGARMKENNNRQQQIRDLEEKLDRYLNGGRLDGNTRDITKPELYEIKNNLDALNIDSGPVQSLLNEMGGDGYNDQSKDDYLWIDGFPAREAFVNEIRTKLENASDAISDQEDLLQLETTKYANKYTRALQASAGRQKAQQQIIEAIIASYA